jgi:NAD-dependent dihydropyrimidine dehydrogenase PreA subunit
MKRNIIHIDDEKCNGCGQCVPACHEGALQIIEGKARLVGEFLCDGLGACLGECPQGAIRIEEREAEAFDEKKVEEHLKKESHVEKPDEPMPCGCPGSMMRDFTKAPKPSTGVVQGPVVSELRQWPVQLRLLNPSAPFFKDADIVVSADCAAFSYGDFHRKFLKGKVLVIFCPKLDEDIDAYVQKLTAVFQGNNIRSITVVKMEVPCCGGTLSVVEDALRRSGKNIIMKEYTISLQGEII